MATFQQALYPADVSGLKKVEPSSASGWLDPATAPHDPSAPAWGFGPVPGSTASPDNLRQFYKSFLIPQYRLLPPSTEVGGASNTPAPATSNESASGEPGPPGPPGPPGTGTNLIRNEIPSGAINGVNDTFLLVTAPNPPDSLIFTKNGQILYEGVAFTLTGNTIVYTSSYIPVGGDAHRAIQYQY